MAYYYLDAFQSEKKFKDEINYYADKALFYDDKLAQSLIAKSLYYTTSGDCKLAVPYLEKALEYNPNSALAMNFLSDIYTGCLPNTEKYLQNAVKGLQLNVAASDSITMSFNYLHVSNAFIQTGFVDEAELYVNKSLNYNPNNLFSEYVKAYIGYARDKDLEKTKNAIIKTLEKDTTRLDVLQELGKICYYMRDFKTSYKYFKKFSDVRTQYNLDIFKHMDAHIGYVYKEMGFIEESQKYFRDYKNYVDNNTSIYKNLELSMYFAYHNQTDKSIEHFKLFSQEDDYHYWVILFLKIDPLWNNVVEDQEFQKIFDKIESKFWKNHNRIKKTLQQKKLI
jgi:tetratricopeptide (TPR) repeat protein